MATFQPVPHQNPLCILVFPIQVTCRTQRTSLLLLP
jgi:hypothetical protein